VAAASLVGRAASLRPRAVSARARWRWRNIPFATISITRSLHRPGTFVMIITIPLAFATIVAESFVFAAPEMRRPLPIMHGPLNLFSQHAVDFLTMLA
jgi:hypothetical protein